MKKHTPGPWVSDSEGWINSASGEVVCEYAGCGSHEAEWWNRSNLALVLSAPDLLDALEALVECPTLGARDRAIEAIAKAKGEQA